MFEIKESRDAIDTLHRAANHLARSFESEPLPGVGSTPWKALWEAARQFSTEQAYPEHPFPVSKEDGRCVLCQQTLGAEAQARLSRFEAFVREDTQTRLGKVRNLHKLQVDKISNLKIATETVEENLRDLEPFHPDLVQEVQAFLRKCRNNRKIAVRELSGEKQIQSASVDPHSLLVKLSEAAKGTRELSNDLDDPRIVQERLAKVVGKRKELALLQQIKKLRRGIIGEIKRRKEREALEAAKSAAATGPITKKIMNFSEESITDVVRDTFTRETDRLRLERVSIARTRAEKGALLHQPKLVGARQKVKLPRVFSEGEQTALGLAAFFTEVSLDGSKSAVILDDPVTSLDHIRRSLVAERLANLAADRQVIMFTHDVAFVADLKRAARGLGLTIAERSVTRSLADDRKPGACSNSHPWKAKDVPRRFHELRSDLERIKKESDSWDQPTYENAVALWAGNFSETWERIFSQEIVGPILAEGGLEVRPLMVKVIARFTEADHAEFQASYSRVSQWAKRHDKSALVNYVAPDVADLKTELAKAEKWFERVKRYKA